MATSPIFGWQEPDDTDLVKDGAAAIRTLGNAIDTTMGTMVAKTIVDAKGDIIAATAADTVARLAVGTNGQVLKANSSAATGLEWGSASSAFSGAAGEMAASTSAPDATNTVVAFGSELWDTDNYHDNSTNNSRFTIPTGKDGYFLIMAKVSIQNSTSGSYQNLRIQKNGSVAYTQNVSAPKVGSETLVSIAGVFPAVAGDYFELSFIQNSGGSLNVQGSTGSEFTITYLGA